MTQPEHIVWHPQSVSRIDRERRVGQRGTLVWLTGLSGCGKSTIANELEGLLQRRGVVTTLLDGDNVRHALCAPPSLLVAEHGEAFSKRFGLGFGPQDREENIRRIASVGELFVAAGLVVLTAFVSPYRRDRDRARRQIEAAGQRGDFVEVFVDTPLQVCEARDPKGLYRKARAGEIANFTGISDPYEPPLTPEVRLEFRESATAGDFAETILTHLAVAGRLAAPS